MKRWLAGLAVIATAGCGSDNPIEPPQNTTHSIRLNVTWPLAAHPLIEAKFVYDGGPACAAAGTGSDSEFTAEFDSEGTVQFCFIDECVPGSRRSVYDQYYLREAYVWAINTETNRECMLPVGWVCQEGLQEVLIEVPDGSSNPACEVPAE
jgi:hypothetical protein